MTVGELRDHLAKHGADQHVFVSVDLCGGFRMGQEVLEVGSSGPDPDDEVCLMAGVRARSVLTVEATAPLKRGTMDEVTSTGAFRKTCLACKSGDHEMSLGPEETCDCPCHGGKK